MLKHPRNVTELIDQVSKGGKYKFTFFWGHQPERDHRVGRGCFSQWWTASVNLDGHKFPTAEHYMMWRKAMLFNDIESAEKILRTPHQHAAKALGRGVRGFIPEQWEASRYSIVVAGNLAKFSQHKDLQRFLLNTKNRILVEASPVDAIWGIGLAADNPRAENPRLWRGLNLLGFALGEVRQTLANAR